MWPCPQSRPSAIPLYRISQSARIAVLRIRREQYIPPQGCTSIRYDASYVESPMTSRLRETPQATFSCCLFHNSRLFLGDSPVDVCISDISSGISLVF